MAVSYSDDRILGVGACLRVCVCVCGGGGEEDVSVIRSTLLSSGKGLSVLHVPLLRIYSGLVGIINPRHEKDVGCTLYLSTTMNNLIITLCSFLCHHPLLIFMKI